MKLLQTLLVSLCFFMPTPSIAGSNLVFCDSCNMSTQQDVAESMLTVASNELLIYNKNTEQLTKWAMKSRKNSENYHEIRAKFYNQYVVQVNLTAAEDSLKTAIDSLNRQYKFDLENEQMKESITLEHPILTDATDAIITPKAYIKAVYNKLVEQERWYRLQQNIDQFQKKKQDAKVKTAAIPSALSATLTKGLGSKNYLIHIAHPNKTSVRLGIDTTQDISDKYYKAMFYVIAKDARNQTIPEDKSSLIANADKTYDGNDSDIFALADFIQRFEGVSVNEVCAERTALSCQNGGRRINSKGKLSYDVICSLGQQNLCN
ncbi:hypothetical protein [Thalassotalea sp. PLHSN55]|uniref:hypothetical protein n=1 Tax=Thalassotalea sp. PLHSN55 TaxID=3435888 RepID=UPI003F84A220